MQKSVLIPAVMLAMACYTRDVVIGARGSGSVISVADHDAASASDAASVSNDTTNGPQPHDPPLGPSRLTGDTSQAARSAGCGSTNTARNASQDSSPSKYLIDLPVSYDSNRPYPLVLAFRGTPENAEMFRTTLSLEREAGDETIIVHPETANGAPFWRVPDDVGLVETLLSHLLESYCIDPTQVFAMGYAQGGWLVSAFACQHADRLRGAALFAGTKAAAPCEGPVAMLVVQGTADMQYSVSNGRETRDFWANLARCDTTQVVPLQGSPCVDYGACQPGAPVRYCEFVGGHELPSFAAAATWRFFSSLR